MDTWIETYTKKRIDLLDPKPEDIDPVDIAHSLSMQCRFNGHCHAFYSTAEHCVRMACEFPDKWTYRVMALLHDAPEAYVSDIVSPLKHSGEMEQFIAIENRFLECIVEKFGVWYNDQIWRGVKEADVRMLATETRDLFPDDRYKEWPMLQGVMPYTKTISPMTQQHAEDTYYAMLVTLTSAAKRKYHHGF